MLIAGSSRSSTAHDELFRGAQQAPDRTVHFAMAEAYGYCRNRHGAFSDEMIRPAKHCKKMFFQTYSKSKMIVNIMTKRVIYKKVRDTYVSFAIVSCS